VRHDSCCRTGDRNGHRKEAIMARNSKRAARRAGETNTAQLRDEMASGRTPTKTSARDVAAAPFDTDDEAAGRPAPRPAVERALAGENLRRTEQLSVPERRESAGLLARTALLIGALALAGLSAWLLLA
jgi:hypothetical protein